MYAKNNRSRATRRPGCTLYGLPVHCLSQADLEAEGNRAVHAHFHRPQNEHNRFMSASTPFELSTLRPLSRHADYASLPSKNARDGDAFMLACRKVSTATFHEQVFKWYRYRGIAGKRGLQATQLSSVVASHGSGSGSGGRLPVPQTMTRFERQMIAQFP